MKKEQAAFIALVVLSACFMAFLLLPAPAKKPVAFFAYGTSLETSTMQARAGAAGNATPAVLPGYRLVFQTSKGTEFGVPNLEADAASSVPGAIHLLSPEQAAALDRASGAPGFYQKISVKAFAPNGKAIDAVTYVLSGQPRFAPPSRPTLLAVSKGLVEFGYGQKEKDALAASAAEAQEKSGRGS